MMEERMDDEHTLKVSRQRQAQLYRLAVLGDKDLMKCTKEELTSIIAYCVGDDEMDKNDIEDYVDPDFTLDTVADWILTRGDPQSEDNSEEMDTDDGQPAGGRIIKFGTTLLHVAASHGHGELVRFLLDMGCDVNSKTLFCHRTVLHLALLSPTEPKPELIEMLLEAGVDTAQVGHRLKYTAIHLAVQQQYATLIQPLVAAGCPLDAHSADGLTALYMAVSDRHLPCIRELVKAGASASIATPVGWTPLFLAVRSNCTEIPQLLVKGNCNVNVKGYGGTALHHAVYHANLRSVKLLLDTGANPNVPSEGGHTPLTVAAYNNSKAIVEALLAHGCNVNQTTSHGYMALHLAAWDGHTEIVQMLLGKGAKHDEPTKDLNTPLALACHGDKPDVVKLLLPYSCRVNNKDKDEDTPLHYVAYNGCLQSLRLLLEAGAHPDVRNKFNATPLWNAIHMKCVDVVYELLRQNVTLNVASKGINQHAQTDHVVLIYTTPRTPLFVALDRGLWDVARVLILAGTNLTVEPWFWRREFPATLESKPDAKEQFLSLACSPLTLKQVCRANIRRQYGTKLNSAVQEFEIPGTLRDFLLLKYL